MAFFAHPPFDPIPPLARHLHEAQCGREHDFDAADCLLARSAAEEMREDLASGGIAVVPASTIEFLVRTVDELTGAAPPPPDPVAQMPVGPAHALYHSQVTIVRRRRDGSLERSRPMSRWQAEVLLVDLNWTHDRNTVSARIESEAEWVRKTLDIAGLQA
jgi:hypothetical protein